jgi:glycosyltransferase EpsF
MDSGGIESVVMNYYRNIDRAKVQFDFYFAEDSTFPQRQELEALGAGIYPIPPYTKVREYHRTLVQAFKERNYVVVHSHLSTMSLFPLWAAWRAKVPVRICHNHSTAEKGEGKKTILKYILRPLARIFATDYFACGQKAAEWMYGRNRVTSGKVRIMPNAIDVSRFAYDEVSRKKIREELHIPQDACVIGHVGRFMYQKNHKFLLALFQYLKDNKTDSGTKYYLLLIGEGELLEEMKKAAFPLGESVIFTGSRTDVNQLYSAMDVFCLPSFYEGMPVVSWEAQANGLNCVFSDKVSDEARILDASCFVSLSAGLDQWTKAIDDAVQMRKKGHSEGIPDIHEWAGWLAEWYLEK